MRSNNEAPAAPIPRWAKISGLAAGGLVVLTIGVLAIAGSGHTPGPGQHAPTAVNSATCNAEPIAHGGGSGATLTCKDVTGAGTTSKGFECRNPQYIGVQVDRDVTAGKVTVTVIDGAGTSVFSKAYSGPGRESPSVNGQDGTWTFKAERDSAFSGTFTVQIYCGTSH